MDTQVEPAAACRRRDLVVAQWHCLRCGYDWTGKSQKPPVSCAKCCSRLWATPYKLKTSKVRAPRAARAPRKRSTKERPF